MSEIVHWIKTGERGARAEFTDSDLITALILINQNPMGRYKLQNELNLSDSSTKSLLNYCKKKDLLEASSGRSGHSLAPKGEELIKEIVRILPKHDICDFEVFPDKYHYYTIISNKKTEKSTDKKNTITSSWELRDIVVSYGGEAILFLFINDQKQLVFPEEDIDLKNYYPDLQTYFENKAKKFLDPLNQILIVSANSFEVARKSAIISGLNYNKKIIASIHRKI